MNQHYENIHRYDFLTKELLEEEYLCNKLTDQQIANKYQMPSKVVVWRKRKKFGIANRYSGKSNQNACINRQFNISKEIAEKILENGTIQDVADHLGCSLIVAKRRLKELGCSESQEHAEKYSTLFTELTNDQKQLIIGTLMGDGCVTSSGLYGCNHSIVQSDYLYHKRQILDNIVGDNVYQYAPIYGGKSKNDSLIFYTTTTKFCLEMRTIFYPNGIKVVPYTFLLDNITEQSLAYWFMDDGSYSGYQAKISTMGFTLFEHVLLKDFFYQKYGIVAIIDRDKRVITDKCWFLRFHAVSRKKLFDLIRPFIIPSMRYKIGEYDYPVIKTPIIDIYKKHKQKCTVDIKNEISSTHCAKKSLVDIFE